MNRASALSWRRFKNVSEKHLRSDAAFFCDDMHLLALALRGCSESASVDQYGLARNLAPAYYDGIAGRVVFDNDRSASRPAFLITVKNGLWVKLE